MVNVFILPVPARRVLNSNDEIKAVPHRETRWELSHSSSLLPLNSAVLLPQLFTISVSMLTVGSSRRRPLHMTAGGELRAPRVWGFLSFPLTTTVSPELVMFHLCTVNSFTFTCSSFLHPLVTPACNGPAFADPSFHSCARIFFVKAAHVIKTPVPVRRWTRAGWGCARGSVSAGWWVQGRQTSACLVASGRSYGRHLAVLGYNL